MNLIGRVNKIPALLFTHQNLTNNGWGLAKTTLVTGFLGDQLLARIHHLDPPGSTIWFNQQPSRGSSRIYQDPTLGSTRIHHWDPPGSSTTTRIYLGTPFELTRFTTGTQQDPTHESTKSHLMDQAGSNPGFHQDPSHGSTRIHQVDPPGSIM